MTISDAIVATTKDRPYITRRGWFSPESTRISAMIEPTNSPLSCVIVTRVPVTQRHARWNPTKDDLTAGDWYPVSRDTLLAELPEA